MSLNGECLYSRIFENSRHPEQVSSRVAIFDEGKDPFQDAKILIDLRNALVHFKPEWVIAGIGQVDQRGLPDLETQLRGKFSLNPILMDNRRPLFPTKCTSHACAQWSVKTSKVFVEQFYSRMGLTNSLDQFSSQLMTV